MGYVIKNTSGLINTRLTDVGRRQISQGNFNISYFQIGDSEVCYTAATNYNQVNNNILMPSFNAQNNTGYPESNKENIKYPYYVSGGQGGTFGIPFMASDYQLVYNSAGLKGFFNTGSTTPWATQISSAYTITSNYVVDMSTLSGQSAISIVLDPSICSPTTETPSIGDFVTIFYDTSGSCQNVETVPILTYKIVGLSPSTGTTGQTPWVLTLDRNVPNYTALTTGSYARTLIYPSGMTVLYDFITPAPYWQTDTLNFESPCDVTNRENTLIWNMNIPWSESPAGIFSNTVQSYQYYDSISYLGSKEYLGYSTISGQTFEISTNRANELTDTYYYNSYDEQIKVLPNEQKAIAIIHYTNQDIDFVYGEKFATIPFDPQNPTDQTGLARNFKLYIPTLMWHKSTGSTVGQTFMIDPPNYDLCQPHYMKSTKNLRMNEPGMRYYQLWDLNPDSNNNLNRIGKVFPDQQIIVIDDDEVVAALSNKSNRNWTLPAPKLSTVVPNICGTSGTIGLFNKTGETLWVTYRLDSNSSGFTNSLHCNYYSKVVSPSGASATNTYNVTVQFGNEFPYLNSNWSSSNVSGFSANSVKLLVQKVSGDTRPSPTNWREIDVTSDISSTLVNGYLTVSGLTGNTFQLDFATYDAAASNTYNLSNYIDIPLLGATGSTLNFGGEYYFYGSLETDISATIYEMKYLVNLGRNQFTNTSNPTWISGTTSYVTEIGLYDSNYNLIVISKLQSPEKRQGVQQYVVKLDF
jgi:hypothetical protein